MTFPFTDEDLKSLKEAALKGTPHRIYPGMIISLIARLEAAEKALMASCDCKPSDHPDKCKETIAWNKWRDTVNPKEWRKSKGEI